jgi:hypothetical protein
MSITEIDMAGFLADTVEASRQKDDAGTIARCELIDRTNDEVVALGQAAVAEGITDRDLVEEVWSTVARHRALMKETGKLVLGSDLTRLGNTNFRVKGQLIRLSQDAGVVLAQESRGVNRGLADTPTFFDMYKFDGLEYAMDQYVKPETTRVNIFDLTTNEVVGYVGLSPYAVNHSRQFARTWGGDMLAFTGNDDYQSPAELNPNHISSEMTPNKLIIGAGYNARFNLLLDAIEAHI